jgi:hypothetical protein
MLHLYRHRRFCNFFAGEPNKIEFFRLYFLIEDNLKYLRTINFILENASELPLHFKGMSIRFYELTNLDQLNFTCLVFFRELL